MSAVPIASSTGLLTRYSDTKAVADTSRPQILPAVPCSSIGHAPPNPIALGLRCSEDPLPEADIVILTWTSAEWFALDHVFLDSSSDRDSHERAWREQWMLYDRGSLEYDADERSGALWGYFQMVDIFDRSRRPWRVLLFKSNAHLAHPPWQEGLAKMLQCIFDDTKADRIYTIGAAGGARRDQRLGDATSPI